LEQENKKCNTYIIKEVEGKVIRPRPVIWFELYGRQRFGNRFVEESSLNTEVKWEKEKNVM